MIVCSLFMDITVVVAFVVFVIHATTYRFPIAMAFFYILRTIIQKLFIMEYPKGYMWSYPGFPSLVVPYASTNDFFFSGHAGGATLCMFEYWTLAKEFQVRGSLKQRNFMVIMQYFGLVTILLQIFLMLSVRGHYTIDLIAGIIFGHYLHIMARSAAPYFDRAVCKLPSYFSTSEDQSRG